MTTSRFEKTLVGIAAAAMLVANGGGSVAGTTFTPAELARLERETSMLPAPIAIVGKAKLTHRNGSVTTLGEAVRGRPAIVAFWSSFCAPCHDEARELIALRRVYPWSQLAIVYLNPVDGDAATPQGKRFLNQTGAGVLDPMALSGRDALQLARTSALSMPRIMFFDRTGTPRAVISGGVKDRSDGRIPAALRRIGLGTTR